MFDWLVTKAGGLKGLGDELARMTRIPDLKVHAIRPNGTRYDVFLESATFTERERCMCRAPELKLVFPETN